MTVNDTDTQFANRVLIKNDCANASISVAQAIQKVRHGKNNLICFETGIYHFRREGSTVREMNNVNNISHSRKNVVFDLENIEYLTVDGGGSEFVFDDILFPFALFRCKKITIKNFTIDFSFPRYCQGDVLTSDETGFELAIDRQHFSVETDEGGHLIFHSADNTFSTETQVVLFANNIFGKSPWDFIFAGDMSVERTNFDAAGIETDAQTTERGIRFTYRESSRRLVFPIGERLLFNYEPRANANILAFECEDVSVENVSIYRGGGMGVVVSRTKNFFADHVAVKVKPGRDECRSTTADGFFFTQCSGAVEIRNSEISETLDDALNIHGFYQTIASVTGDGVITKAGREEQVGLPICSIGEKLTFSDAATHRYKSEHTVSDRILRDDGSFLLRLDGDFSELNEGDLIENDDCAADFLFENNRVFGCPHIRVSDNGKIILRGNTFVEINAILVIDLIDYWYETGSVKDMTIEENDFIDCPRAGGSYPITIYSTRKNTTDILHENITISHNRFTGTNSHTLSVSGVKGLNIFGNRFEGGTRESQIAVSTCTDTREEGNLFSDDN